MLVFFSTGELHALASKETGRPQVSMIRWWSLLNSPICQPRQRRKWRLFGATKQNLVSTVAESDDPSINIFWKRNCAPWVLSMWWLVKISFELQKIAQYKAYRTRHELRTPSSACVQFHFLSRTRQTSTAKSNSDVLFANGVPHEKRILSVIYQPTMLLCQKAPVYFRSLHHSQNSSQCCLNLTNSSQLRTF